MNELEARIKVLEATKTPNRYVKLGKGEAIIDLEQHKGGDIVNGG